MNSVSTAEDDGSGIRCNELGFHSNQNQKIGKFTALRIQNTHFLVGCVLSQVVEFVLLVRLIL